MCEEPSSSFTVLSHGQPAEPILSEASSSRQNLLIPTDWQSIPLQKKQNTDGIIYISALPQKLLNTFHSGSLLNSSKSADEASQKTVLKTALKIVSYLEKIDSKSIISEPDHNLSLFPQRKLGGPSLLIKLWSHFQIETQQLGWISCRLSNAGISQWLEQVNASVSIGRPPCDLPPLLSASPSMPFSSEQPALSELQAQQLWQAQYSYARCCSLLRLWQPYRSSAAAGQRPLAEVQWFSPSPARTRHRATNPKHVISAQEQLIHVLIDTADNMFWIPYRFPSKQYLLLLKRAAQIYQSFDRFLSEEISGFGHFLTSDNEPVRSHISLSWQAKFHLVSATHNILETLLHHHLRAQAPHEL